jgi:hypothetical protein
MPEGTLRVAIRAVVVYGYVVFQGVTSMALAEPKCVYDLAPKEPYSVLGTLVVPQSSSVAVMDCGKSLDEVKAELARQAKVRVETRALGVMVRRPSRPVATLPETSSAGAETPFFRNCSAARAAGRSRIRSGEPGYASHLDRDNDGIGCE